jgi:hypothetical protein
VRTHEPNGFGPYNITRQAATDGHWKLILREGFLSGGPPIELLDLDADPFELVNLWPPDAGAEQAAFDALQAVIAAANPP